MRQGQFNNTSKIVANDYDFRTHQSYFIASLKTRFPQLTFTEQKDSTEIKDTTVLLTSNLSSNLSSLKITLSQNHIDIELPKINFIQRFNPAIISSHIAPDADVRIPPRLQALDFIQQIIEDEILFRCYKRNGKIIRTEVVNTASNSIKESKNHSVRGSFIKFLSKYEVTDFRWSGSETQR